MVILKLVSSPSVEVVMGFCQIAWHPQTVVLLCVEWVWIALQRVLSKGLCKWACFAKLMLHNMLGLVTQSCPTLCSPMDCSPSAPLSMRFSRQEYWSGLPRPPTEDLPNPGTEPRSPAFIIWATMKEILPVQIIHNNNSHCSLKWRNCDKEKLYLLII